MMASHDNGNVCIEKGNEKRECFCEVRLFIFRQNSDGAEHYTAGHQSFQCYFSDGLSKKEWLIDNALVLVEFLLVYFSDDKLEGDGSGDDMICPDMDLNFL